MTQSTRNRRRKTLTKPKPRKKCRVLITGAGGKIGSHFAKYAHLHYDLRLMVQNMDQAAKAVRSFGEVVVCDLGDLEGLRRVCRGIDTVVHLAANAMPTAPWESLLNDNIVGTYNLFTAAKAAGCRRVIFASSIHTVAGYPPDYQVHTDDPVIPGNLYGVSKCFGENLARYMASHEGLSAICLRIGAFLPPKVVRGTCALSVVDSWTSPRDLGQLIEKCIEVENLDFAILHALSGNRFNRLDITDARERVGYDPQDDFTDEHPVLRQLNLNGRGGSPDRKAGGKGSRRSR